LYILVSYWWF